MPNMTLKRSYKFTPKLVKVITTPPTHTPTHPHPLFIHIGCQGISVGIELHNSTCSLCRHKSSYMLIIQQFYWPPCYYQVIPRFISVLWSAYSLCSQAPLYLYSVISKSISLGGSRNCIIGNSETKSAIKTTEWNLNNVTLATTQKYAAVTEAMIGYYHY